MILSRSPSPSQTHLEHILQSCCFGLLVLRTQTGSSPHFLFLSHFLSLLLSLSLLINPLFFIPPQISLSLSYDVRSWLQCVMVMTHGKSTPIVSLKAKQSRYPPLSSSLLFPSLHSSLSFSFFSPFLSSSLFHNKPYQDNIKNLIAVSDIFVAQLTSQQRIFPDLLRSACTLTLTLTLTLTHTHTHTHSHSHTLTLTLTLTHFLCLHLILKQQVRC